MTMLILKDTGQVYDTNAHKFVKTSLKNVVEATGLKSHWRGKRQSAKALIATKRLNRIVAVAMAAETRRVPIREPIEKHL